MEAASLLGVSDRTFRRYLGRYEEHVLEGLIDQRLDQASHRRALVDEVKWSPFSRQRIKLLAVMRNGNI